MVGGSTVRTSFFNDFMIKLLEMELPQKFQIQML